ncbi:hypothetical protein CR194_14145 [Salipaludibacillus keqinensis]|uniref:HTH luxR-type domain-containing protein n=1 Tax=Salipaludibacillus keqinensis TaxID=2045207 RepID=A0A323TDG2_9BACI|nr:LuxR C-terminal-related transcriptional regulator [Salipaludibacillus keqinensis]PYZ92790.1 hypothetical protein CR194_14145 [Salipaludibacillus keqinensis]
MLGNKVSVGRIVVYDNGKVIENDFLHQFSKDENIVHVTKQEYIFGTVDDSDILFFVAVDENIHSIDDIIKIKEKKDCKVLLVNNEDISPSFLSFLHLPIDGLISLSFLRKNLPFVIDTIRSNKIVLDPMLHRSLILEIERKKTNKRPIKKLVLEKDKVEEILKESEQNVLQLLLDGYNNQKIADELYFSTSSVSTTISHLLKKLQVRDRTDATVTAIRRGWVEAVR